MNVVLIIPFQYRTKNYRKYIFSIFHFDSEYKYKFYWKKFNCSCLKSKSNNITCPVTYDTDPASSECKPECIKSNDNTTSCTFCYRYVFNSTNVNNSLGTFDNECGCIIKNGWCSKREYCICYPGYYPDPSNPIACMRMPNYNKKNKCNNTVQQSTISKTSEETSVATYIFNL